MFQFRSVINLKFPSFRGGAQIVTLSKDRNFRVVKHLKPTLLPPASYRKGTRTGCNDWSVVNI